jgi:hypothetical protein
MFVCKKNALTLQPKITRMHNIISITAIAKNKRKNMDKSMFNKKRMFKSRLGEMGG